MVLSEIEADDWDYLETQRSRAGGEPAPERSPRGAKAAQRVAAAAPFPGQLMMGEQGGQGGVEMNNMEMNCNPIFAGHK